MKPLFQNRKDLNKNIQEWGCYFIDLLNIYQDETEYQLTDEIVNAIYVMSSRIKNFAGKLYLEKDCYVNDIEGIAQIVSGLTNVPLMMKLVKPYEEFTHTIGCFVRFTSSGKRVVHFVELYNNSNSVKHDPWMGGSRTAREGILKDKRFINTRRL